MKKIIAAFFVILAVIIIVVALGKVETQDIFESITIFTPKSEAILESPPLVLGHTGTVKEITDTGLVLFVLSGMTLTAPADVTVIVTTETVVKKISYNDSLPSLDNQIEEEITVDDIPAGATIFVKAAGNIAGKKTFKATEIEYDVLNQE